MAIDFTLSREHEAIRDRVRTFIEEVVKPGEAAIDGRGDDEALDAQGRLELLIEMRKKANAEGLWLPHMPEEWGGMGLGHVALAMVQAEAAKSYYGPWVLNCQAPDEGNMHTLLHWAHAGAGREVSEAAVRRYGLVVFRDDGARGGRF